MAGAGFDAEKGAAFSGRMLEMLNDSCVALMVGIGHQTELFEVMSGLPASTSQEIARAANLNERYVREWLGAMVTGRIVDYDPDTRCYLLPPEHAASLTSAAGASNMATQMQWVACLAEVEQQVVQTFRKGGGVPYSAYERFHTIMNQVSGQTFDETLVGGTLPLVPGLVEQLDRGIDVLDVGCGSGHAVNVMARAFPKSRFTGYDFSEEGIAAGRLEARGLANAQFEVVDVATIQESARFDFITAFDAIHDQAQPRTVLAGIARVLRPTGSFLMVDTRASSNLEENVGGPMAPFLYSVSTLHCMTVSLALDGEGLGAAWGEQKAHELLIEAGFEKPTVYRPEENIINSYYVTRLRSA